jgi:chemotaxis protein CheX
MNTILVTKDAWGDELKEILNKNNLSPVHTVKSFGLAESKLSGKKNLIIYEMEGDIREDLGQLRDLMKDSNRDRVKVLLVLDRGVKDAISTLGRYENVKFIFQPLTKERLQIGLRTLLFARNQPPKISIDYIKPFIETTRIILKQMAFTEVEKKEITAEAGLRVHGDISGVMALFGKANGFVVISMGNDAAFELVKRMTQGNIKKDEDRIVESGIMELLNIISGQAQAMFDKEQYHFDFTTPTLIKGKGHEIYHGQMANSILVRFMTDYNKEIYLQICLKDS